MSLPPGLKHLELRYIDELDGAASLAWLHAQQLPAGLLQLSLPPNYDSMTSLPASWLAACIAH